MHKYLWGTYFRKSGLYIWAGLGTRIRTGGANDYVGRESQSTLGSVLASTAMGDLMQVSLPRCPCKGVLAKGVLAKSSPAPTEGVDSWGEVSGGDWESFHLGGAQ